MSRRDEIAEILRLQEAARWDKLPPSGNIDDRRAPGPYPDAPAQPDPAIDADPYGLRQDMDRHYLNDMLENIHPTLPMPRPRRR